MQVKKTWLTVHFTQNQATIELTLNYETGSYTMTHGTNDNNVTFNGDANNFAVDFDRLECVKAALNFAFNELGDKSLKKAPTSKAKGRSH